jgi:gas vesicle protein
MRNYDDDEPYVVIEERSDIGTFLLGIAIGAGAALLFAPRAGAEVRGEIKRRVKRASDGVAGTFHDAREAVEQRLESARIALEEKRQKVADAVAAGRAAARDAADVARRDLHERLTHAARPRTGQKPGAAYGAAAPSDVSPSPDAGAAEVRPSGDEG